MLVSEKFDIEKLKHIDIFRLKPDGPWSLWYHRPGGYVQMFHEENWTCKEDVEDFVFRRMLDGKL